MRGSTLRAATCMRMRTYSRLDFSAFLNPLFPAFEKILRPRGLSKEPPLKKEWFSKPPFYSYSHSLVKCLCFDLGSLQ
jgi:hypothetical protein